MAKRYSVASVKDMGPLFTDNPNSMIGQDGAFSIYTTRGLFFYFGDTVLGKRRNIKSLWYPDGFAIGNRDMAEFGDITGMLTNTGLFCYDKDADGGLSQFEYVTDSDGNIRQLIPDKIGETPDKWRNWCLHGIQIGETLYLYYIQVEMFGTGFLPVNFRVHGSGLAKGSIHDMVFTRIEGPHGGMFWLENEPMFANSVIDGNDGYLYMYGVRREKFGVQRCYVSRVKPGDIEDRYAYRYWDGKSWSEDLKNAVSVLAGMPNEMSISWNNWLGCWLAVNSYSTVGKIVAQTADRLEGPWSKPKLLHTIELQHHGLPYPLLIYAGKEHPYLAREDGRILAVTYIEFEEYYPHLLEIELERPIRRRKD